MLPHRAAEAPTSFAAWSATSPAVRFLRCDVASVPAYQGPFDAVVFNDVLSHQADPADAIRRAALRLARPGARVVVSERQDPEDASPDASPLDVGSLVADLPLEAASAARDGKAMNAAAPRTRTPRASRTTSAVRYGRSRYLLCAPCATP